MPTHARILPQDLNITFFKSLSHAADHALERPQVLVAMNVEKLMRLRSEPDLFNKLREVTFYPDGAPMLWFARTEKYKSTCRVPGVELWLKILDKMSHRGGTVLIIGASQEVASSAKGILQERYPSLHFTMIDGFQDEHVYFSALESSTFDAVFVAMGSPKQEHLIARFYDVQETLYMGLGGSLDVLAGRSKRAPLVFRKLSIEFLYRLLREPTRVRRQVVYLKFLALFCVGRVYSDH